MAETKAKTETKAKAAPKAKAEPKAKTAKPKTDGAHKTVEATPELQAVIGKEAMPRTQVISKLWDYIRTNKLQDPADKRNILADDNLKKVFGKDKVSMFEMNKYVSQHLK